MRCRHRLELERRFGQRDEEDPLPCLYSGKQELQTERRLAGSGVSFDRVKPGFGQATMQNVIETGDAGGKQSGRSSFPRGGADHH